MYVQNIFLIIWISSLSLIYSFSLITLYFSGQALTPNKIGYDEDILNFFVFLRIYTQ